MHPGNDCHCEGGQPAIARSNLARKPGIASGLRPLAMTWHRQGRTVGIQNDPPGVLTPLTAVVEKKNNMPCRLKGVAGSGLAASVWPSRRIGQRSDKRRRAAAQACGRPCRGNMRRAGAIATLQRARTLSFETRPDQEWETLIPGDLRGAYCLLQWLVGRIVLGITDLSRIATCHAYPIPTGYRDRDCRQP
jgi:hypothetical protein